MRVRIAAAALALMMLLTCLCGCVRREHNDGQTTLDFGYFAAIPNTKQVLWDIKGNRMRQWIVYNKKTKIVYYWTQADGISIVPYIDENGNYVKWENGDIVPIE